LTATTTNTFYFFYQTKDSCQEVQKKVQTQEDLQARVSTLENQLSTSLDQTAKFFLEYNRLRKDLLQEKDKNQKLQEDYRKLNDDFQFIRREGNVNLKILE
jgi:chromosome segregation ATPase